MSVTLNKLLEEADLWIEKKASAKKTAQPVTDDEVTKLASELAEEDTVIEKVARAMAIVETMKSISNAETISKFEKVAAEKGYSEEDIDTFLREKGLLPTIKIPESLC